MGKPLPPIVLAGRDGKRRSCGRSSVSIRRFVPGDGGAGAYAGGDGTEGCVVGVVHGFSCGRPGARESG